MKVEIKGEIVDLKSETYAIWTCPKCSEEIYKSDYDDWGIRQCEVCGTKIDQNEFKDIEVPIIK